MKWQGWTAVVAAGCAAACIGAAVLLPIPFVVWAPGTTADLLAAGEEPPVQVAQGVNIYPTSGRLLLASLTQTGPDARVSLVEALYAYLVGSQEAVPRAAVYPSGADALEIAAAVATQTKTAQSNATAAALRSAGIKVDPVPLVEAVNSGGPAAGKLEVGDIVLGIRYASASAVTNVQTAADASAAVASGKVGDQVIFTVLRGDAKRDATVTTQGSKSNPDLPVAGVSFAQGYRYDAQVVYKLDEGVGGNDIGLMLALALYDKVTPDALLENRVVAGTGSIDANGVVGRVSGVRERVVDAERAGASVFLVPAANCAELADVHSTVRVVPVTTLAAAVDALGALADPTTQKTVKGCS
mgnify:CR=1 FL=1